MQDVKAFCVLKKDILFNIYLILFSSFIEI